MANLTPTQQAQVEKVKKQIANELMNNYHKLSANEMAIKILALEGLAILDDDQSLPQNGIHSAYIAAQRELLDVNFKKVIPKGEAQ